MPEKLQNLSEKVLHIKSGNSEGDKTLPVKYLSEIITARIEEIVMAIIYEIEQSGFADMLRSGLVITGGVAQTANICSFIHDISGYKARIGYPRHIFSWSECVGLSDSSAATSIGLLLAAKNSADLNCAIAPEWEEEPLAEVPEAKVDLEPVDDGTFVDPEIQDEPLTNLWGEDEKELEKIRQEEEEKKKEEEREKKEKERKKKEEERKKREAEKKARGNRRIGTRIWTLFDDMFNDMDDNNV